MRVAARFALPSPRGGVEPRGDPRRRRAQGRRHRRASDERGDGGPGSAGRRLFRHRGGWRRWRWRWLWRSRRSRGRSRGRRRRGPPRRLGGRVFVRGGASVRRGAFRAGLGEALAAPVVEPPGVAAGRPRGPGGRDPDPDPGAGAGAGPRRTARRCSTRSSTPRRGSNKRPTRSGGTSTSSGRSGRSGRSGPPILSSRWKKKKKKNGRRFSRRRRRRSARSRRSRRRRLAARRRSSRARRRRRGCWR